MFWVSLPAVLHPELTRTLPSCSSNESLQLKGRGWAECYWPGSPPAVVRGLPLVSHIFLLVFKTQTCSEAEQWRSRVEEMWCPSSMVVHRVSTPESLTREVPTSISGLGERFGPVSSFPSKDHWRLGSHFSCGHTYFCNVACLQCFCSSERDGKYMRVKGKEGAFVQKTLSSCLVGFCAWSVHEFLKQ